MLPCPNSSCIGIAPIFQNDDRATNLLFHYLEYQIYKALKLMVAQGVHKNQLEKEQKNNALKTIRKTSNKPKATLIVDSTCNRLQTATSRNHI
jgi:hypothetical protein